MFTYRLDVGDQGLGRVSDQLGMRYRTATTALIEQDDAIDLGIEKTSMVRFTAGTGTTMNKQDRQAIRVTALFDMQDMRRFDIDAVTDERFNFGE